MATEVIGRIGGSVNYQRETFSTAGWAWATGIITIVAGGAALYLNEEANSSYNKYMNAITPDRIDGAWNDYRQNVRYRNYSLVTAASLGSLCIYLIIRSSTEQSLYGQAQVGPVTIAPANCDGIAGLRISFGF